MLVTTEKILKEFELAVANYIATVNKLQLENKQLLKKANSYRVIK